MSLEAVLVIWTCIALIWWITAIIMVAVPRHLRDGPPLSDIRTITVFKPLPGPLNDRELKRYTSCIESFVADLDKESELLIGCHQGDEERLKDFVMRMNDKYPHADVTLVAHENPNKYPHPKVSWLLILARYAAGELWFWSDADMMVSPGTITSLREDYNRTRACMVTSPYIVKTVEQSMDTLDALYVNLEFYPGVVLLERLNHIRFAFGSGMLFRAEDFRRRVDWDVLGRCLAEDFYLGRVMAPTELGSARLSTIPSSRSWPEAIMHYLRWQKTIRWCSPASFALQLIVIPVLGWLVWLAFNPTSPVAWFGFLAVMIIEMAAALIVCRILKCDLRVRYLGMIWLWSLMRGLTWLICWTPWPVVWRGRRWWSPWYSDKHRRKPFENMGMDIRD